MRRQSQEAQRTMALRLDSVETSNRMQARTIGELHAQLASMESLRTECAELKSLVVGGTRSAATAVDLESLGQLKAEVQVVSDARARDEQSARAEFGSIQKALQALESTVSRVDVSSMMSADNASSKITAIGGSLQTLQARQPVPLSPIVPVSSSVRTLRHGC